MKCYLAIVFAFGSGFAFPVAAQWQAQVSPGTRVQLRLPEAQYQAGPKGQFIRGRVTHLAGDTLYLAVTDSLGPLAIPRTFIQKLEISRGVPSRGISALQRGLMGAVLGAATFYVVTKLDSDGQDDSGDAALIGGAIGLGLGGLTGALWPRERWKRVRPAF